MVGSNDDMPPWLTPVDEIDQSADSGIFSGNMKKMVIGVAVVVVAVFAVAMWMVFWPIIMSITNLSLKRLRFNTKIC